MKTILDETPEPVIEIPDTETPVTVIDEPPKAPTKKDNTTTIIITVVLLLAVAALFVWLNVKNSENGNR